MLGLLRFFVDRLNDDLFCRLVAEKQLLMQFTSDIIYTLIVPENPLCYGMAYLTDKPFHV
jgi:hypothetical protein